MKRQMLLLAALLMVGLGAWAQKAEQRFNPKKFQVYAVGFYNQENLFDTCHDAGKNDYEYLPAKGWNSEKYTSKLKNMSLPWLIWVRMCCLMLVAPSSVLPR